MVVTVTVDMMNARIASVAKKESGNKVWIKLLDDVKQSIRNCTVI